VKKLAKWGGALLQAINIALPFFPGLAPWFRELVIRIWPLLLLAFTVLILWGYQGQSDNRSKLIKYFVSIGTGVLFIAWLGWPWERIQDAFARLRTNDALMGELHDDQWMTEREAYYYVVDTLKRAKHEVFPTKVRTMLPQATYHHAAHPGVVRMHHRCDTDTAWVTVNDQDRRRIIPNQGFDGTTHFSEFCACRIEYLTEDVYQYDWLGLAGRTQTYVPAVHD